MPMFFRRLAGALMLSALPALSGCDFFSNFFSGDGSPPPAFTIGGTVTGLTGTGLVLQNNGGDDLAISVDGRFVFSTRINNGGTYDVTILTQPGSPNIGCSVTGGSGTISDTSIITVLVTCLSFTTAEEIETEDLGDATAAKTVADAFGNVTAVWTQFDGTRYNLWANRYLITSGWGTPQEIETEDLGDVSEPNLVIDSGGNVTVVWTQSDGTRYNQWANRYTGSWGTAQRIETEDLGDADSARLVVDANRNVTVVWDQHNGTRSNQWANRFTFGGTWGTAQIIDSEDLGNVGDASLVVDGSGNVTVVWLQSDGARNNQWANRYTTGTGWGTAQEIETDDTGPTGVLNAQLVIDDSGNVTAIWMQDSAAPRWDLWANRYTGSWGTAQRIDSEDLGDVVSETLVVDASGNVTAVWSQSNGTRDNLWANRFSFGGAWGTAEIIETENLGSVDFAALVVDGSGNVTAAWRQHDGTRFNLWANRYSAGSWGTAGKIEAEDLGDVTSIPRLVVDDSGNVTAAWAQDDGARDNLWANRYSGGVWGTAVEIETSDIGSVSAFDSKLLIDGNGNVTAVWRQFGASYIDLWANRFVPGSGWSTAMQVDAEDFGSVGTFYALMDAIGRVMVTWEQNDGTRDNGWAASLQ